MGNPPQSEEEREQFTEIVELWMDGRDRWIPGEWFLREGVERVSW